MEDISFKVLWIDDEHEGLSGLKAQASLAGIQLVPYKSLNAGLKELEKNAKLYDGVLLDAKIFEDEENVPGTEDTKYIFRANERILQLDKKFKIFVLTGQAELFEDPSFNHVFKNVYPKGNREARKRLFADIKEAARNQENYQIKNKYKSVFKICNENCLKNGHFNRLIEIIKSLDNPDNNFSRLRKVYESLFRRLSELHILPQNFTKKEKWISGASWFLSEKHNDYIFLEKGFIHPLIANTLHSTLLIMQDGCHYEGVLELEVSKFTEENNTGYTYNSTIYGFLEVLSYFAELMEENQDKDINSKRWEKKPENKVSIKGVVSRDADNNYFLNDCVFPYKKAESEKLDGRKVEITIITKNINERTHQYPNFAKEYKLLN